MRSTKVEPSGETWSKKFLAAMRALKSRAASCRWLSLRRAPQPALPRSMLTSRRTSSSALVILVELGLGLGFLLGLRLADGLAEAITVAWADAVGPGAASLLSGEKAGASRGATN